MKYKKGDILIGKVNGSEIEIVEANKGYYRYKELKTGKTFQTNFATLEQCLLEKSEMRGRHNEKEIQNQKRQPCMALERDSIVLQE